MSEHAGPRRRGAWFGHGRTRALLTLGLMAALGVTSTAAYWVDSGTVTGATISTGTLDLTAGATTGAENLGGSGPNNWNSGQLSISNLVPGESVAASFVVRNSGTAPLRYNAKVRSTTNDLTSGTTGLQVQVFDNGAASNTGTQASSNRTGSCTGTSVFNGSVSTTPTGSLLSPEPQLTTTGATRTLCVKAMLPTTAPSALQGKSTQVVVELTATQVNAP